MSRNGKVNSDSWNIADDFRLAYLDELRSNIAETCKHLGR